GRGALVLASGRRTEELERAGEPLQCDLSDREAVAALPHRAGRVDILVANAALPSSGLLAEFSPEQIDRALDVNLRAPIMLAEALAPEMVRRGSGHLVFVSSLNGKSAAAGTSIYSATKFGLRGFASGLRDDLHGSGVGVTTIFPGFISDAGMFHEAGVDLPPGVTTRTPDQVAAGVVRGIEGNKHEVDVAPLSLRAASKVAGAFPELAARLQRRMGSRDLAEKMAAAQVSKR
ncbi:MAG: SDR family NAD(P)-dependent oxidoreductase, partial [Thermoleophilaceae bacterium]|nr:SDR family NAD(P)-dependent oxidoreductase [Thermoleophilaceae bacterium]